MNFICVSLTNSLVALAIILGLAFPFIRWIKRRSKSYEEILRPQIEEAGLTFVRSIRPSLGQHDPFPKFQLEFGRPYSNTPIGRGEYTVRRIVTVIDTSGYESEMWAKLEFELFRLRRVVWSPSLEQIRPDEGDKGDGSR